MDIKTDIIRAAIKHFPAILPHLTGRAAAIYCEYKAVERDKKEPGRTEKMRTEKRLKSIILKRFERQKRGVIDGLNMNYKDVISRGVFVPDSPEEYNLLVQIVYFSILQGIRVIQDDIGFSLADGSVNERALQFAQAYVTDWLAKLDDVTQKALRDALSLLPSGSGTIGDVIKLLEPVFGEDRAWRIAITETTRIFAGANQIFANELASQYPGFEVVKQWFTNADDRVCPICAPLNDKQVGYNKPFAFGVDNPPAHVNCRCWTAVTVKA